MARQVKEKPPLDQFVQVRFTESDMERLEQLRSERGERSWSSTLRALLRDSKPKRRRKAS